MYVATLDQGPGHIRPTLEIWEQHEAVALRILDGWHAQESAAGAPESFVVIRTSGGQWALSVRDLYGAASFTSESGQGVLAYLRGESFAPTLPRVSCVRQAPVAS